MIKLQLAVGRCDIQHHLLIIAIHVGTIGSVLDFRCSEIHYLGPLQISHTGCLLVQHALTLCHVGVVTPEHADISLPDRSGKFQSCKPTARLRSEDLVQASASTICTGVQAHQHLCFRMLQNMHVNATT